MPPGALQTRSLPPPSPGPGPTGRSGRVDVGRVALGYALAVWVTLVLVHLVGDRTAPTYLLGLVGFWWLAPTLPLLVVAAVRRRWLASVVLLVPALLVVHLVVPDSPLARGPGHHDLRVATWNITGGAPVNDVYALVKARSPDVLLLQEVRPQAREELAALRSRYPYESFAPLENAGHWGQGDGNAVLSRYPIRSITHVKGLSADSRPTDEVVISVGGHRLALLSMHLASPCVGCAPGMTGFNPAGGTGEAARVRVGEAHVLAALTTHLVRSGTPVVLAGDINSSDLNQPLHILTAAGLRDAQRSVGWGPGLTRGAWPGIARVDVVLVSGLRPVSVTVPGRGASTHAPVVTDLAWS